MGQGRHKIMTLHHGREMSTRKERSIDKKQEMTTTVSNTTSKILENPLLSNGNQIKTEVSGNSSLRRPESLRGGTMDKGNAGHDNRYERANER